MFNFKNNEEGFTLMETLATISIMGILATISVTSILPVWQNANAKIEELKTQTETLNQLQEEMNTLTIEGVQ